MQSHSRPTAIRLETASGVGLHFPSTELWSTSISTSTSTFHSPWNVITTMQSTSTARALRRGLSTSSRRLGTAPKSTFRRQLPASQRCLHYRAPAPAPKQLSNRRAFSISAPRRFASVEDDFDPKCQDRESDQVDVCIVGGGKVATTSSHPPSLMSQAPLDSALQFD